MKCPHCGYAHGYHWEGDEYVEVYGDDGNFYTLPVKMERCESDYHNASRVNLLACPSCTKTFID